MERSYKLIAEMMRYPVAECGEGLLSIRDTAAATDVEMAFSQTLLAGQFERLFFIRAALVDDLLAIARDMNARGWILKIEEGFRTREMQTALGRSPAVFDKIVAMACFEQEVRPPSLELMTRRLTCLVANCPAVGTHMCGAAVDVTVLRRDDGTELSRGAPYLEMSELTPMDSPFISPDEQENRREITRLMEAHGFLHYPGEFWHYNKGDALYQMMTRSGPPGRYGPVHWNAATGTVTPYEDPTAPLTPPDLLQRQVTEALTRMGIS